MARARWSRSPGASASAWRAPATSFSRRRAAAEPRAANSRRSSASDLEPEAVEVERGGGPVLFLQRVFGAQPGDRDRERERRRILDAVEHPVGQFPFLPSAYSWAASQNQRPASSAFSSASARRRNSMAAASRCPSASRSSARRAGSAAGAASQATTPRDRHPANFSTVWKTPVHSFHSVENGFPQCGTTAAGPFLQP